MHKPHRLPTAIVYFHTSNLCYEKVEENSKLVSDLSVGIGSDIKHDYRHASES